VLDLEQTEMPAEVDQRGPLVVKLELHALYIARIITAAVDVILHSHLVERRGLVARQSREIEVRVAAGADLHVIGHIGAGEFAQLVDHPVGSQLGALAPLDLGFVDRVGNIKFC
jgi:hypothetical protein